MVGIFWITCIHQRRALELGTWGNFIEKFKTLPENVQKLIIKKLHGGM
jgi:hypothetical protein